ncbi:zinc knuckle CX2CX4HX4C [Artemisia annua]|uniref:Zinc knuckle CX2CX4HX4C n=1 Tax=Artemisia annua TaxID=35608 RepID=A0A2U1PF75_ARTAN|nr:zinc knuckle CX2CX4HX4C [Artemisia annua]
MRLEKEKITKVPVWVRIHDIPSVVYSKAGISLIAKQLGRIIRFDAGTNDMCKNPWGRYSYARVLIELSAELDVLESIEVEIPLPKGKGHYMEVLEVESSWFLNIVVILNVVDVLTIPFSDDLGSTTSSSTLVPIPLFAVELISVVV